MTSSIAAKNQPLEFEPHPRADAAPDDLVAEEGLAPDPADVRRVVDKHLDIARKFVEDTQEAFRKKQKSVLRHRAQQIWATDRKIEFALLSVEHPDEFESAIIVLTASFGEREFDRFAYKIAIAAEIARFEGPFELATEADLIQREREQRETRAKDSRRKARATRIVVHGRAGMKFYYSSTELADVIELSPGQHTEPHFFMLANENFWQEKFGKENSNGELVVAWSRVTSALMEEARSKPSFDPAELRGRGPWIEEKGDDKRFVYNTGDSLLIDGERVSFADYHGSFFYRAAPHPIAIAEKGLDAAARATFAKFIRTFRWAEKSHADFVLGWLVLAPIAAALNWVPMLWLTARAGSGKSFLTDTTCEKLFRNALNLFNGSTTDKGISGALSGDRTPFIYDEAEAAGEAARARLQTILEALRATASASKGRRSVGLSGGGARSSKLMSPGLFSSISDVISDEADETRFLRPRLTRFDTSSGSPQAQANARLYAHNRDYVERVLTPEFSAAFLAFSVLNFTAISKAVDMFIDRLEIRFGTRRNGQRFGSVFGAVFFWENERAPEDDAEIDRWFVERGIEVENLIDAAAERSMVNHVREHILSTRVEAANGAGRFSISELIHSRVMPGAAGDRLSQKNADATLQFHGIRVDENGERICFAAKHDRLIEILNRTPYGKNSLDALRELRDEDDKKITNIHFSPVGTKSCLALKLQKFVDVAAMKVASAAAIAAAAARIANDMRNRLLTAPLWHRNVDRDNVAVPIRILVDAACKGGDAARGINDRDAARTLAEHGIIKESCETIIIARGHPRLRDLLGRGNDAVGRDYADALAPLIVRELGKRTFAGVDFDAIEIEEAEINQIYRQV